MLGLVGSNGFEGKCDDEISLQFLARQPPHPWHPRFLRHSSRPPSSDFYMPAPPNRTETAQLHFARVLAGRDMWKDAMLRSNFAGLSAMSNCSKWRLIWYGDVFP